MNKIATFSLIFFSFFRTTAAQMNDSDSELDTNYFLFINSIDNNNFNGCANYFDKKYINKKDIQGKTPLMHANSKEMAEYLISMGSNINIKNEEGMTSLMYFISCKRQEIISILIKRPMMINFDLKDNNGYDVLDYTKSNFVSPTESNLICPSNKFQTIKSSIFNSYIHSSDDRLLLVEAYIKNKNYDHKYIILIILSYLLYK